jgi:plasmid maintenance system antidote protein VapI
MGQLDTNATLWMNLQALMLKHWGEENINRLARECQVGPATVQRIKDQRTSVGLEVLDKIANNFNLSVWQLLVPGLDPTNPPTLQPVSAVEKKLYEKIMTATREIMAAEPTAAYEAQQATSKPIPPAS